MQRRNNPNLMILEQAVNALGALVDDMVFIGGCATGLLITDLAAPHLHVLKIFAYRTRCTGNQGQAMILILFGILHVVNPNNRSWSINQLFTNMNGQHNH
jgi:hypothetical protein